MKCRRFGSGAYLAGESGNKYFIYELGFTAETQYTDGTTFELIGKNASGKTVNPLSSIKVNISNSVMLSRACVLL